jgi:hypothetical protein
MSSQEEKIKASWAFRKAWNYDFVWNILVEYYEFGDKRTKMGRADYEAGGNSYNPETSCLFEDPEDVFNFDPYEVFGKKDIQILVSNFEKNYRKQCIETPDAVNMTGIYNLYVRTYRPVWVGYASDVGRC